MVVRMMNPNDERATMTSMRSHVDDFSDEQLQAIRNVEPGVDPVEGTTGPAAQPEGYDREALVAEIAARLEAEPEFERVLLADMYATLYEFRLTIEALQTHGVRGLLGLVKKRRHGKA